MATSTENVTYDAHGRVFPKVFPSTSENAAKIVMLTAYAVILVTLVFVVVDAVNMLGT
ncbi:hypothetical protein [Rhodococcus sp. NPDC058521]|uniref:hypothetical protein n=1 Tax=Rhodococcus sp. NPDC058521 TaxID=3346536 RepID=UPI0036549813